MDRSLSRHLFRVAFALLMAAVAAAAGSSAGSLIAQQARLGQTRLVLASQSPRRREIFDLLLLSYEVIVSDFEENLDKSLFRGEGGPQRYAETNAVCKARDVATKCFAASPAQAQSAGGEGASRRHTVVVGSDTIVDLDGCILEKPKSQDEARATLRRLSGRSHYVHTGVGIFTSAHGAEEPAASFYETTKVHFAELSDAEIEAYVLNGEPMDKAGSYGIQGVGGQFVERLEGCYFNVMGFPMRRFSTRLAELLEQDLP